MKGAHRGGGTDRKEKRVGRGGGGREREGRERGGGGEVWEEEEEGGRERERDTDLELSRVINQKIQRDHNIQDFRINTIYCPDFTQSFNNS